MAINIVPKVSLLKSIVLLLAIPALATMHVMVVYSLLAFESPGSLKLAEAISVNNPDVFAARANQFADSAPDRALGYWLKAAEQRPNWPYYQLGALEAEYRTYVSGEVFSHRLQKILDLAPNERGLDRALFELVVFRWDALTVEQQAIMIERFASANQRNLRFAMTAAAKVGQKTLLCGNLPWRKVAAMCKNNASY